MIGIDTTSGPADSSMRDYALGLAEADPRIVARDGLARELIDAELGAHDVIVVPSRYEAWCYVALEALRANRPVLATPVGGLAEVVDDAAGWQTAACSPGALRAGLERLTDAPQEVFDRIEAGSPRARFEQLTEPGEIIDDYLALAERRTSGWADRQPARPRSATTDRSTAVILAPGSSPQHRQQALDSIAGQTRPVAQVLELDADGRLAPIAGSIGPDGPTDLTGGFAAFAESSGCSYVAVLRGDDVLHAEFVAATAAVLDAGDGIAVAYSDIAVFGARVADWVEATSVDGRRAETPAAALRRGRGALRAPAAREDAAARERPELHPAHGVDAHRRLSRLGRAGAARPRPEPRRPLPADRVGRLATAYVARALVGCRLVTEADVRATALAESLLSSLEAAESRPPRCAASATSERRRGRRWTRARHAGRRAGADLIDARVAPAQPLAAGPQPDRAATVRAAFSRGAGAGSPSASAAAETPRSRSAGCSSRGTRARGNRRCCAARW